MAFDFMNFNVNEDVVPKTVNPFVDEDGNPLPDGALHNPKAMPDAHQQKFPSQYTQQSNPQRVIRPLGVAPMDFASLGPMGQAASLNSMTSGVNDLVNDEMNSRVSQAREERRMQHEKEMMAMRMQAQAQAQAQAQRSRDEGDIIRSLLNG